MESMSKASITRLGRRAGIRSMSEDCYNTVRSLCSLKLLEVVQATVTLNNEHSTKTIMSKDAYEALKLLGYNVGQSRRLQSEK